MYLVLIEGGIPPPNSVSISAQHVCLTLSVSHLTLGLQPLLEEVHFAPVLESLSTKQIVLPVQIQHILIVNDVPSLPMKLLLGVLYTGQLHLPDIPSQGLKDSSTKSRFMTCLLISYYHLANSGLCLGLCVILAEYFGTGVTDVCLKAVKEKLAQDSSLAELLALLGRRTGLQVLLDAVS